MAGLQRSVETFRRSGSSGLVWEECFAPKDKKQQQQVNTKERSRSNGGGGYRTGLVSPALDPPSPKISACGFCGIFANKSKPGPQLRR